MANEVLTQERLASLLIDCAYVGKTGDAERWLNEGANIDAVELVTGLSALHIAIGRNHVDLVKFLLERGATVRPDASGRWPSTIAEQNEADGRICDMIVDAEAKLGNV